MLQKTWIINISLLVLVIFFGIKTFGVWFGEEKNPLETATVKKRKSSPGKRIVKKRKPPESAYRDVVAKDLFSEDREEYIPEEPESDAKAEQLKIPGKKIILYGIVLIDDYQSALISNPVKKSGEPKDRWVKIGDTVGDLKVADIQKESITLAQGDDTYNVLLYDKDNPKKRTFVKKSPKRAISRKRPPRPKKTVSKKKLKPPGISKKTKPAAKGYEMVDTPFGKVKRRKK